MLDASLLLRMPATLLGNMAVPLASFEAPKSIECLWRQPLFRPQQTHMLLHNLEGLHVLAWP